MASYNVYMIKQTIVAMVIAISIIAKANMVTIDSKANQIAYENQLVKSVKSQDVISEMISDIAPVFNQNPALIKKIIYCESSGKVSSHDGGRGTNITGIHDTTFDYWLKKYQAQRGETLNKDSTYDQIKMMSWAFSQGYANQWTTFVAYKNGGIYTFYSSLMGKTYTSRCK